MDTTTFYSEIIPAHHRKPHTLRQAPYLYALRKHATFKTGQPIALTMKTAAVNKLIATYTLINPPQHIR